MYRQANIHKFLIRARTIERIYVIFAVRLHSKRHEVDRRSTNDRYLFLHRVSVSLA